MKQRSLRAAIWLAGASLILSTAALGDDRADLTGSNPGQVAAAGEGFLPGLPHLRLFETEEQDALATEALIVDAVYTAFERAIQQSGYEIEIETGDAVTFYPGDFDRIYWSDLVTQASPLRLQVTRSEVDYNGVPVGEAYQPSWIEVTSPEELIELERWDAASASTTLEDVAASGRRRDIDGDKELVALTSFAVRIAFDNRDLDYRATIFWLAENSGQVRFQIEDRISDYVDTSITTKSLVAPVNRLLEIGSERALAEEDDLEAIQ